MQYRAVHQAARVWEPFRSLSARVGRPLSALVMVLQIRHLCMVRLRDISIPREKRCYYSRADTERWEAVFGNDVAERERQIPVVEALDTSFEKAKSESTRRHYPRTRGNEREWPILEFGEGELTCLDGQSRIAALKANGKVYALVYIVCTSNINPDERNDLLYGHGNAIPVNNGLVYRRMRQASTRSEFDRAWELLSPSLRGNFKTLWNCQPIRLSLDPIVMGMLGMAPYLKLGAMKALKATCCLESIHNYLWKFTFRFWSDMMGEVTKDEDPSGALAKTLLSRIERQTIDKTHYLAPGKSSVDLDLLKEEQVFSNFDEETRKRILEYLVSQRRKFMIPSLGSFFVHKKVLYTCSAWMKQLLGLTGKAPLSTQPAEWILRELYEEDEEQLRQQGYRIWTSSTRFRVDRQGTFLERRETSCRQLWLFIMRQGSLNKQHQKLPQLAEMALKLGFAAKNDGRRCPMHRHSLSEIRKRIHYMKDRTRRCPSRCEIDHVDREDGPFSPGARHLLQRSKLGRLRPRDRRMNTSVSAGKHIWSDLWNNGREDCFFDRMESASEFEPEVTPLYEYACIYRAFFADPYHMSKMAKWPLEESDAPDPPEEADIEQFFPASARDMQDYSSPNTNFYSDSGGSEQQELFYDPHVRFQNATREYRAQHCSGGSSRERTVNSSESPGGMHSPDTFHSMSPRREASKDRWTLYSNGDVRYPDLPGEEPDYGTALSLINPGDTNVEYHTNTSEYPNHGSGDNPDIANETGDDCEAQNDNPNHLSAECSTLSVIPEVNEPRITPLGHSPMSPTQPVPDNHDDMLSHKGPLTQDKDTEGLGGSIVAPKIPVPAHGNEDHSSSSDRDNNFGQRTNTPNIPSASMKEIKNKLQEISQVLQAIQPHRVAGDHGTKPLNPSREIHLDGDTVSSVSQLEDSPKTHAPQENRETFETEPAIRRSSPSNPSVQSTSGVHESNHNLMCDTSVLDNAEPQRPPQNETISEGPKAFEPLMGTGVNSTSLERDNTLSFGDEMDMDVVQDIIPPLNPESASHFHPTQMSDTHEVSVPDSINEQEEYQSAPTHEHTPANSSARNENPRKRGFRPNWWSKTGGTRKRRRLHLEDTQSPNGHPCSNINYSTCLPTIRPSEGQAFQSASHDSHRMIFMQAGLHPRVHQQPTPDSLRPRQRRTSSSAILETMIQKNFSGHDKQDQLEHQANSVDIVQEAVPIDTNLTVPSELPHPTCILSPTQGERVGLASSGKKQHREQKTTSMDGSLSRRSNPTQIPTSDEPVANNNISVTDREHHTTTEDGPHMSGHLNGSDPPRGPPVLFRSPGGSKLKRTREECSLDNAQQHASEARIRRQKPCRFIRMSSMAGRVLAIMTASGKYRLLQDCAVPTPANVDVEMQSFESEAAIRGGVNDTGRSQGDHPPQDTPSVVHRSGSLNLEASSEGHYGGFPLQCSGSTGPQLVHTDSEAARLPIERDDTLESPTNRNEDQDSSEDTLANVYQHMLDPPMQTWNHSEWSKFQQRVTNFIRQIAADGRPLLVYVMNCAKLEEAFVLLAREKDHQWDFRCTVNKPADHIFCDSQFKAILVPDNDTGKIRWTPSQNQIFTSPNQMLIQVGVSLTGYEDQLLVVQKGTGWGGLEGEMMGEMTRGLDQLVMKNSNRQDGGRRRGPLVHIGSPGHELRHELNITELFQKSRYGLDASEDTSESSDHHATEYEGSVEGGSDSTEL